MYYPFKEFQYTFGLASDTCPPYGLYYTRSLKFLIKNLKILFLQ